jgi:hypothetical protein
VAKYLVLNTKIGTKKIGKYKYGAITLNRKELEPLIGKYVHVWIEAVNRRDMLSWVMAQDKEAIK